MSTVTTVPTAALATRKSGRYLYIASVGLLCAWVIVPLYFLLINTLSSPETVNGFPKPFIPEFDMGSMSFFAGYGGMLSALKNSIIVAVMTMVLSISIGAPAGYALSRFDFRGKELFRMLILLTRAFPLPLLALPLAVLFIRTGLDDTAFGLALVHTTLAIPFAVLILILPGIAASAIFAFVISWNEVFAAAVLTIENRTLTAFLLVKLGEAPLHLKFAGGFILVVPALVFIFAVRKYLFAMWGIANR